MLNLNLLPQTSAVNNLINLVISIYSLLPENEKKDILNALKEFETSATAHAWSTSDLNIQGLSLSEQQELLSEFILNLKKSKTDLELLKQIESSFAQSHKTHVKVSYIPAEGLDQLNVAPCEIVLPMSEVSEMGLENSFKKACGLDPKHIIKSDY